MKRIALPLMLMGLCAAVVKSAEPTAIEKARSALGKNIYELFKDQIKDKYPSHVSVFAVAQAKITAAKTKLYCPLRTSRCGMNPTCNHPKRKITTLDVAVGKVLFRTGKEAIPTEFKNYAYFGKTSVKTGDDVYISLYVYERSRSNIARIKRIGGVSGSGATKPSGGRAINLKGTDSGKTISAAVGDTVIIELEANPTTGFSWDVKPAAKDAILVLKSKKFLTLSQLNPEIQPALGQGGVTTFTYQVANTGKAAISLSYRRPWEKEAKPAKVFNVTIKATRKTSPVVTGRIIFSQEPDAGKISRIVVSIRNTALADGPSPLIGTVELKPPFKLPVTFAVPYDPAKIRPNPMFYSISARVLTVVDGSEKLYYINDTRHGVFGKADDTKRDIAVKKLR